MATKSEGKKKGEGFRISDDCDGVGLERFARHRREPPAVTVSCSGPSIYVPVHDQQPNRRQRYRTRVAVLQGEKGQDHRVVFRVVIDERLYEAASVQKLLAVVLAARDADAKRTWYPYIGMPYSMSALAGLTDEKSLQRLLVDRPCVDDFAGDDVLHRDFDREAGAYRTIPQLLHLCGCGSGGFIPDTKANRRWLLKVAARYRHACDSVRDEIVTRVEAMGRWVPAAVDVPM